MWTRALKRGRCTGMGGALDHEAPLLMRAPVIRAPCMMGISAPGLVAESGTSAPFAESGTSAPFAVRGQIVVVAVVCVGEEAPWWKVLLLCC